MKEVISMQWNSAVFTDNARQPPEELMHYGIPGQTWGIRRFQNKDGSYTTEGKERYGRVSSGKKGASDRAKRGKDPNDRSNWKRKDVRNLSDEELRRRNNRLQAEANYRNSMTPQWKKTAKQWGGEAVKAIFITTATTLLANVVKNKLKKPFEKKANSFINSMSKVAVSTIQKSKSKAASYNAARIMRDEIRKG